MKLLDGTKYVASNAFSYCHSLSGISLPETLEYIGRGAFSFCASLKRVFIPKGVKVIEYNARFGDPETEAVLPLLKTDIVDICNACIDGTLSKLDIEWEDKTGFCVVIASGEYPGSVVKGHEITIGDLSNKITLFHSGTKYENGHLVNNRVICVTTIAKDIAEAREIVYKEIDKIKFENCRYRKDIGIKD